MDRARPHVARALLFALLATAAHAADEDGPPAQPAPPPPVVDVGEVSVTATRAERSVLDVPGNVTVIDRAAIERSGARDVAELLRREAGIFVANTTTNPDGWLVDARGFNDGGGNGSSLLVLVNGRRVNEPDTSSADWSWLRLDHVERIEIVRGPASALWGDGAVSGVVNVLTRGAEGPLELDLRGWSGTYDTDGGSLFARGTQGDVSGLLYLDRPHTDGYRDESGYSAHRAEGSVRWNAGERVVLGIDSGWSSDDRRRPGSLTQQQIRDLGRRAANPFVDDDALERRRFHLDGVADVALGEDLTLKLAPFYAERSDAGQITSPPDDVFGSAVEVDSQGGSVVAQLDRPLAGLSNRLVAGTDLLFEHVDVDALFRSSFGDFPTRNHTSRHVYGGFVQDELSVTPDLLASLGLRFDYANLRGEDELAAPGFDEFRLKRTFWSPKAALTWRFADPVSAYVSYAKGFRLPNVDEAFGVFGFTPGLDPQKSDSYETGLKLRRGDATANLAFYWMDVTDQILFDHEIDDPLFGPSPRNVNVDQVRHRGIETSGSWSPIAWLELFGSYTFDDTEVTEFHTGGLVASGLLARDLVGNELPVTPRHRGNAGVLVKLPWWTEVGLNANYVGSRWAANDLTNEFQKLPKFATYDALLAVRPPLTESFTLHVTFAVRNLFDREYAEFGGERTFARGDPTLPGDDLGFFPSPERSYEVGLRVTVRP
jgi:iron complex outermembrane receptor protein